MFTKLMGRLGVKPSAPNTYYEETMSRGQSTQSYDRPSSTAIIYQSELDYISRCILDYTDIETGGQLFGYWTATGTPVVLYVIGPGKNAMHHPTSFIQDQDYLQPIGKELYKRYRLQHIGEWHSHHRLDLARPSGGDLNTMQYGVGKPGFPRLLLCIGNCTKTSTTVNPFNFHESNPSSYEAAAWDVVNCNSPYRNIIDMELASILRHPRTQCASHLEVYTKEVRAHRENDTVTHWLLEKVENVEIMKSFLEEVNIYSMGESPKTEILDSGEPLICFMKGRFQIKFPFGFPKKSPILYALKVDSHEMTDAVYEKVQCADCWSSYRSNLLLRFRDWLTYAMQIANTQAYYSEETLKNSDDNNLDNNN